jgi:hypothetical protein
MTADATLISALIERRYSLLESGADVFERASFGCNPPG